MQTTDELANALMQRILDADGKAFTFETVLGTYEIKEQQTDEGWEQKSCSSLREISENTAQVQQLGKRFPSLKITYPQKELSAIQADGNRSERIVVRQSAACIKVPDDFVKIHGGFSFRKLLSEKWAEQTAELTGAIAGRLRQYELRTARMFGENRVSARVRIESEFAGSDIWSLPLSQFGLLPLGWDGEIVGMAQDIAGSLRQLLGKDCGEALRVTVKRNEAQQSCTVELKNIIPAE